MLREGACGVDGVNTHAPTLTMRDGSEAPHPYSITTHVPYSSAVSNVTMKRVRL